MPSMDFKMGSMSEPMYLIEFFEELHRLAQVCLTTSAAHEFVENPPKAYDQTIKRCLHLRAGFLAESEERTLSAYLEL